MKINTFEECLNEYNSFNGWEPENDTDRSEKAKEFPYSVIVEGAYLENDMAQKWCLDNIGKKDENWADLWYGKIGYDYGFWELFFKNQKDADFFKNTVPTFYAETVAGKWRTDGYENHIDM